MPVNVLMPHTKAAITSLQACRPVQNRRFDSQLLFVGLEAVKKAASASESLCPLVLFNPRLARFAVCIALVARFMLLCDGIA